MESTAGRVLRNEEPTHTILRAVQNDGSRIGGRFTIVFPSEGETILVRVIRSASIQRHFLSGPHFLVYHFLGMVSPYDCHRMMIGLGILRADGPLHPGSEIIAYLLPPSGYCLSALGSRRQHIIKIILGLIKSVFLHLVHPPDAGNRLGGEPSSPSAIVRTLRHVQSIVQTIKERRGVTFRRPYPIRI